MSEPGEAKNEDEPTGLKSLGAGDEDESERHVDVADDSWGP